MPYSNLLYVRFSAFLSPLGIDILLPVVTLMSADTELVIATVDHPSLQPGDPYNYAKSVVSTFVL